MFFCDNIFFKGVVTPLFFPLFFFLLVPVDGYEINFLINQAEALKERGEYTEAIALWSEVIDLEPHNDDYKLEQAHLCAWTKHYEHCEELLCQILTRNPCFVGAWILWGRVHLWRGEMMLATIGFRRALQLDPCNEEALEGMLSVEVSESHYCSANLLLERFLSKNSTLYHRLLWHEIHEHLNPACALEGKYASAKEKSTIYNLYTTKQQYVEGKVSLFLTPTERTRFLIQPFLDRNWEENLPLHQNNYRVIDGGVEGVMENCLSAFWEIRSSLRFKESWQGEGPSLFPFHNTFSVEPGIVGRRDDACSLLFLSAYLDSYPIKNFSNDRAELLRQAHCAVAYQKNLFEDYFWLGGSGEWIWFSGGGAGNHKYEGILFERMTFPQCASFCDLMAQYRIAAFERPNPNYYSYRWQDEWQLIARCFHRFDNLFLIEGSYMHGWQHTRDLFDPGQAILADPELQNQFLVRNRLRLNGEGWILQMLRLEAGVEYYWDSLDYRAWIAQLLLRYQF